MGDEKGHEYRFKVDGKIYESPTNPISGSKIKADAGVPANYQLFLEGKGKDSDRAISDSESVDLAGEMKNFYAAPPATFG